MGRFEVSISCAPPRSLWFELEDPADELGTITIAEVKGAVERVEVSLFRIAHLWCVCVCGVWCVSACACIPDRPPVRETGFVGMHASVAAANVCLVSQTQLEDFTCVGRGENEAKACGNRPPLSLSLSLSLTLPSFPFHCRRVHRDQPFRSHPTTLLCFFLFFLPLHLFVSL
jgi:hypothetical protein